MLGILPSAASASDKEGEEEGEGPLSAFEVRAFILLGMWMWMGGWS